jgi:hypothetical protein
MAIVDVDSGLIALRQSESGLSFTVMSIAGVVRWRNKSLHSVFYPLAFGSR